MDQAHVKGFLQKHKDTEEFGDIFRFIEKEFGGKFPCCQPLDKKYCTMFYERLWDNEKAKEMVETAWHGTIKYNSKEGVRIIYV